MDMRANSLADAGPNDCEPEFDLKACRTLMRGGSRTFFAASLLLPPRVRWPATALYAFCRVADDAIDEVSDKHRAMRSLIGRLDDVYRGRPQAIDADRALSAVVRGYDIPRALLDALLEGFYWDAQGRRYDTLQDLHDYGARVAGTVGAMMTLLMGVRSEAALARACDLGVAMQLTNIARDVGEDARAGRLYLPQQWLREEGLEPQAWLQNPVFDARVAAVVNRLLRAADDLYARAEAGVMMLPKDCQVAIRSAAVVYAEIGHEVERQGFDSINQRAVVSTRRKMSLILQAMAWPLSRFFIPSQIRRRLASHEHRNLPALKATRFLVQAACEWPAQGMNPGDSVPQARHAGEDLSREDRMAWLLELFERQELARLAARQRQGC